MKCGCLSLLAPVLLGSPGAMGMCRGVEHHTRLSCCTARSSFFLSCVALSSVYLAHTSCKHAHLNLPTMCTSIRRMLFSPGGSSTCRCSCAYHHMHVERRNVPCRACGGWSCLGRTTTSAQAGLLWARTWSGQTSTPRWGTCRGWVVLSAGHQSPNIGLLLAVGLSPRRECYVEGLLGSKRILQESRNQWCDAWWSSRVCGPSRVLQAGS